MDPLRQAIALQMGAATLDAIEAKVALSQVTRERDSAIKQAEIQRAEITSLKAIIPDGHPPKPKRGRRKANGVAAGPIGSGGASEQSTSDTV